jgi:1,4-alpha-glucan branching enzyme
LVDSVSVKVNVAPPVELDKETGHSDDDATWVKTVPGAKAGDQYKYQIQAGGQTREFVNPRSRQLTGSGPDAASVIVDTADVVQPFDGPTFNNLVIYELHVGTFHAGKDGKFNFAGVAEKLDYLKDLGVNAIQLTVRSFSEPLLRNGKLLVSC